MERWEPLSAILPQARAVAEVHGSRVHQHWLDFEIYGLGQVPQAKASPETEEEKAAAAIFLELHAVIDARLLPDEELAKLMLSDELPQREAVAPQSIGEIERNVEDRAEHHHGHPHASPHDHGIRPEVMRREQLNVLQRVRSYLYDYLSRVWLGAEQEVEWQRLLGPDYRLVVERLDALSDGLGRELLAALALLHSDEPAQWRAAAVVCLGVLRKAGKALVSESEGFSEGSSDGNEALERLRAYIRRHRERTEGTVRQRLEELGPLLNRIEGSRSGDGRLRRKQAERLLVDVFRLLDSLGELGGLKPSV